MLTIIQAIYYLLKSMGVIDRLMELHHEKTKAQAIADAPETKAELVGAFRKDNV